MLDALAHLAQPTPDWLAALTPDGIQAGPLLWRRQLLEGALVYPGSGDDGSPIRQLSGIVRSFIFLDLDVRKDTFVAEMTKKLRKGEGFAHHRLVGLTEFDAEEFIGPSLWLLPPEALPVEDATPGFGLWGVYETTVRGSPERFSLLILNVEALSALIALFSWTAPFAIVAQDHGFGTRHWRSFSDRIRRFSRCWIYLPTLIVVGENNQLGEWTARGRLLSEDRADESVHKQNRLFYELPANTEPERLLEDVAAPPGDAVIATMSWSLIDRSASPELLREMISLLGERPVPIGLVPRIVVAYDRLIWANEADEAVLVAWPTLVSAVDSSTIRALAAAPQLEGSAPLLRAWTMNRVAARTVLDSPAWQKYLSDEVFVALREIADRDPEDVWRELLDSADLRVSEAQIAAWAAADTPERRWAERSRLRRPRLGAEPDSTVAPALSEAEREALMETPPAIRGRGRRCPDCRTEDHVRWFLVSRAPEETADGQGRATWMSVCAQCRVRLMALDARPKSRTSIRPPGLLDEVP